MSANPVNLRNTAWIIGLVCIALAVFSIIAMLAFSAPPWPVMDLLMLFLLGGSYIFGLLIGKKWPLTGGIMGLILPILMLLGILVSLIAIQSGTGIRRYMGFSIIMDVFMMIPGFLYLLSWFLQRKWDQKASIGEMGKSA